MTVIRISSKPLVGLLRLAIRFNILIIAILKFRSLSKAISNLKDIINLRATAYGQIRINRAFIKRGRVYQTINMPGWPSGAFNRLVAEELTISTMTNGRANSHQTVLLEITRKCSLKCEHCSFAGNRNTNEGNGRDKPHKMVPFLYKLGYRHIQFTGGEPLEAFEDLIKSIKTARGMDSWLLTSGYKLSQEKAKRLSKAGLSGIVVSLDHWDKEKHNIFRGNDQAFMHAKEAIANSLNSGLLVGVSLCSTREFTTSENLGKYLELIKTWKVHFLRILEAKESGRYSDMDIRISPNQRKLLEEFYYTENLPGKGRTHPVIGYTDLMNRDECSGKGKRFIYVDADGLVHPCSFSLNGRMNLLHNTEEKILEDLKRTECINCNLEAETKPLAPIVRET